jgi:hypothetical protein
MQNKTMAKREVQFIEWVKKVQVFLWAKRISPIKIQVRPA